MSSGTDMYDQFFDAINNIAQRKIDSANIDMTVETEVIKLKNVEIGEYQVLYQGNTFSAFSLDPTVTYRIGDKVYVLVPAGDFSSKKIILGKSKLNAATSGDKNQNINFFKPVGPNWLEHWYKYTNYNPPQPQNPDPDGHIDHNPLQLTVVPKADVGLLQHSGNINSPQLAEMNANWKDYGFIRWTPNSAGYEDDETAVRNKVQYPRWIPGGPPLSNGVYTNPFEVPEIEFNRYSRAYDWILINAEFRTDFQDEHLVGEYSLEVKCLTDNALYLDPTHPQYSPNQPKFGLVTFELGLRDMIGAPYAYGQYTPNKAAFPVPKGQVKGLYSVALKQNGAFVADNIKVNYATVGGVPVGYEPNYERNNVKVRNIEIHFAEKVNLDESMYWVKLDYPTGSSFQTPGQRLLIRARLFHGQFTELTSNETCTYKFYRRAAEIMPGPSPYDALAGPGWKNVDSWIDPINNAGEYQIDKDIPNELTILDQAVPFEWKYKVVIIYGDKKTDGSQKQGVVVSEEFTIRNSMSPYDMSLLQFVNDTNTSTMLEILDAKKIGISNGHSKQDWFGDYYRLLNDNSYVRLNPTNPPNGLRQQGPMGINEVLNYDAVTVLVNCFDPQLYLNGTTGNTSYVACLEKTFLVPNGNEFYVRWKGKTTYGYDAKGSIKWEASLKDNTLYADFQWLEGFATDCLIDFWLGEECLSNYDVYRQNAATGGTNGLQPLNSMLRDVWIGSDQVIHFKVAESYDAEKTNNIFTMKIHSVSTDRVYNVDCEIQFVKDGEQGTQGSDWIAQILPTNHRSSDGIVKFTYPLTYPAPLVIRNNSQWPGSAETTTDVGRYKVFLRPFVSKNGVRVEEMNPTEGYSYKVYWDCRYAANAMMPGVRNNSFLRMYDRFGALLTSGASGFSPGVGQPGTQGFTEYINIISGTDPTVIEVQWDSGSQLNLDDVRWNFYVKAQIDVYQGDWNPESQTNVENQLVASINAIYPIDIFFNNSNQEFDPKYIKTNWPQFVDYNATGYDPEVMTDVLYFKYSLGEYAESPLSNSFNYPPANLTPDIQTIEKRLKWDLRSEYDYFYKPKPYFFYQDGYNGALSTQFVYNPFAANDQYIRNQVFRLNNYGNVDINAWDGQGIDINEENGTLFAPTVGAGYKDPYTNTFTGVIMGVDKSQRKLGREVGEVGNRQGYSPADNDKRKYMTGLYGYQEGFASFGIMENGTAFFGRADRGGRIIVDGYNATIYGGANGTMTDPIIGDEMWNTMRLTLVDLTHATGNAKKSNVPAGQEDKPGWHVFDTTTYYDPGTSANNIAATEVDGILQGFNGGFFGQGNEDAPRYNDDAGWVLEKLQMKNDTCFPWWYRYVWERAYTVWSGTTAHPMTATDEWLDKTGFRAATADPAGNPWTRINYWQRSSATASNRPSGGPLQDNHTYTPQDFFYDANGNPVLNKPRAEGLTGFAPNRASTTPAIEIGQHVQGLTPAPIPWDLAYSALRDIEIPGCRNFMVTYDGTLWAMNACVRGNIIASNILGGSLYGTEIGVGYAGRIETYDETEIRKYDNWIKLQAPIMANRDLGPGWVDKDPVPCAFYVNPEGEVWAKEIHVQGGSLHIGTFHLIGKKEAAEKGGVYGDLMQFGESDFVGATHFYGAVGVGPAIAGEDESGLTDAKPTTRQSGNFMQTRGTVAMGVFAPTGQEAAYHGKVAQLLTAQQDYLDKGTVSHRDYMGTIETCAFFGIGSSNGKNLGSLNLGNPVEGHMWPMKFFSSETKIGKAPTDDKILRTNGGYFTTMTIFKSPKLTVIGKEGGKTYERSEGANYFRVSPFGTEARVIFIKDKWLDEDKTEEPNRSNSAGFIGEFDPRDPTKQSNQSFGIAAWGKKSMAITSERNIRLHAIGALFLMSGNDGKEKQTGTWETAPPYGFDYGENMFMMSTPGYKQNPKECTALRSVNGIQLLVHDDDFSVDKGWASRDTHKPNAESKELVSGLELCGKDGGKAEGTWFFSHPDNEAGDIHILRGNKDNNKENTEIWITHSQSSGGVHINCNPGGAFSAGVGREVHTMRPGGKTADWGPDSMFYVGFDGVATHSSHYINNLIVKAKNLKTDGFKEAGKDFTGLTLFDKRFHLSSTGGYIKGDDKEIWFMEGFKDEKNQHNIYARYAG